MKHSARCWPIWTRPEPSRRGGATACPLRGPNMNLRNAAGGLSSRFAHLAGIVRPKAKAEGDEPEEDDKKKPDDEKDARAEDDKDEDERKDDARAESEDEDKDAEGDEEKPEDE